MNEEATMKQPHAFHFSTAGNKPSGLLGKIVAFILSIALFALAFMFSLAALAVVAVVGVLFAGWFWWKTRALRRQMRGQMREQGSAAEAPDGGLIIEGEVIRDSDATTNNDRRLR